MIGKFYITDLKSEHGWEEKTYASVTNLLRTCLAKHSKDAAVVNNQIKPLTEVSKLKKHISIVCDRMSKGGQLAL